MNRNSLHNPSRTIERLWLLAVTILLIFLFGSLYKVLTKDFEEVPQRIADGSMVNLNDDNPGQRIGNLLIKGFYFEDLRDVQLISTIVSQRLQTGSDIIDNIGELNKSKYNIDAKQAFASGGASFKKRDNLTRCL